MFIKLVKNWVDSNDEIHESGTILDVDKETAEELIKAEKAEKSDGVIKEVKPEDMSDAIKKAVDEAVKAIKPEKEDVEVKDLKVDDEKIEVTKDAGDQEFKSFSEFMIAVKDAGSGGRIDQRLLKSTGQNETTAADGGYLVQHDIVKGKIFDVVAQESILYPKCSKMTVGTQANGLKIVQSNESERSATTLFGGVRLYSPDEGVAITAFKQAVTQKDISLKRLNALNYMTDELLMDAPMYEQYISQKVGQAYAWILDDEIINGTKSTVSPIVNDSATVEITFAGDNPTNAEINSMYTAMLPSKRNRAEWYLSNSQYAALLNLDEDGTYQRKIFQPLVTGTPSGTLMGRPINVIEQAGADTDESSFMFLDLSEYLIINKGGIDEAVSIHVKFVEMETAFRWSMRVGGASQIASAITLPDSTKVSAFVTRD